MWVMHDNVLIEVPDDAPMPPGSAAVELPTDFFDDPEAYRLERRRIVRRPKAELKALRAERAANRLTRDEIAYLKRAIAEQRF